MKFIDIRAVRKDRRSKKWHIEYADGGSPSCIDTPISTNNKAISKECVVDINKTLHEYTTQLIYVNNVRIHWYHVLLGIGINNESNL